MDVQVTTRGPLFNGTADRVAATLPGDIAEAVGTEGQVMVRQQLSDVLKNPTGFYQSRIDTLFVADGATVWDSNVIYGNWLEGTSSRNATTRFKGYATFRRVTQQLDARAVRLAQPAVDDAVRRLS